MLVVKGENIGSVQLVERHSKANRNRQEVDENGKCIYCDPMADKTMLRGEE
jgi:hypothetical protein